MPSLSGVADCHANGCPDAGLRRHRATTDRAAREISRPGRTVLITGPPSATAFLATHGRPNALRGGAASAGSRRTRRCGRGGRTVSVDGASATLRAGKVRVTLADGSRQGATSLTGTCCGRKSLRLAGVEPATYGSVVGPDARPPPPGISFPDNTLARRQGIASRCGPLHANAEKRG